MRQTGIHSAEIQGVAQPVHLLPTGVFRGRDGRGPYRLADAEVVIAATLAHYGDALPIDRDHARDFLPAGSTIPAAGWIRSLEARPDGVWGLVEWTARAAAEIEAKEYRFISPVFKHRPDGTITRIERATLTNYPNLVLEAVASEMKEPPMLDEELRQALGLDEEATAAQAVEAVQAIRAGALAPIARSLGLEATAAAAQIEARAAELTRGAAQPDPAQFVPMGQFEELADELGQMKAQLTQRQAAGMVEAAQAAGKVSPAMADWARSYALESPDGFTAWASAAPVIVTPGAGKAAGKPPAQTGSLDDEDLAVCHAMGLDPDAWKKSLEQEAR